MAKKQASVESAKKRAESAADQFMATGKAALEMAQEAVERAQEAVEKVQEEGSKLLGSLAKEGDKVRDQTQKMAEDMVEDFKSRVGDVRGKANDTMDNLERVFEDRVSRVLKRMGIPTSDDFQAIAKRLETLHDSVRTLAKKESAAAKKTSTKATNATKSKSVDDLQAINGIGPAMESKLNAQGISNYRQIAQWSESDVERIEQEIINSAGRVVRDRWVEQAKQLHFQKYDEQI